MTDISPIEFVTMAMTTVIVPTVGWIVTTSIGLARKLNLLDARFEDRMKDLNHVLDSSHLHGTRLTKVEEAVIGIEKMMQRNDAQFGAILTKLEVLPRVLTMMENYGHAIGQVVPRSEVEARLKSLEEQLKSLSLKHR